MTATPTKAQIDIVIAGVVKSSSIRELFYTRIGFCRSLRNEESRVSNALNEAVRDLGSIWGKSFKLIYLFCKAVCSMGWVYEVKDGRPGSG